MYVICDIFNKKKTYDNASRDANYGNETSWIGPGLDTIRIVENIY